MAMGWSDVMAGFGQPGYSDMGVNPDMGNPFGQAMQMQPSPQQVPDPGMQPMPDFSGTGQGDWGSMVQPSVGQGGFSFAKLIAGALSGMAGGVGVGPTGDAFAGGFQAAQTMFDKKRAQDIQDQQLEQQRQLQDANLARVLAETAQTKANQAHLDEVTKQLHATGEMTSLATFLDKSKGTIFDLIPINDQKAIDQHMADLPAQGNTLTRNGVNGLSRTYIPMGDYMVGIEFNPNKIITDGPYQGLPVNALPSIISSQSRMQVQDEITRRQQGMAYLTNTLGMDRDKAQATYDAYSKLGIDPITKEPIPRPITPQQDQQNSIDIFRSETSRYAAQANAAKELMASLTDKLTGQIQPGNEQQYQAAQQQLQDALKGLGLSQNLANTANSIYHTSNALGQSAPQTGGGFQSPFAPMAGHTGGLAGGAPQQQATTVGSLMNTAWGQVQVVGQYQGMPVVQFDDGQYVIDPTTGRRAKLQ